MIENEDMSKTIKKINNIIKELSLTGKDLKQEINKKDKQLAKLLMKIKK